MNKTAAGIYFLLLFPFTGHAQSFLSTYEGDTAFMEQIEVLYGENQPLKRWVLKKDAPDAYWKIFRDKARLHLISEGRLIQGKKDSIWVRYDRKGRKAVSIEYRQGFINGREIYYNTKNQSVLLMYTYKNSIKNGPYVIYHSNGAKWEEGSFRNGVPNGVWKNWDANGKQLNQRIYRDGILVEEKIF